MTNELVPVNTGVLLKFYDETVGQINKIIDEYSHGGTPAGKFTRGLYYRGIK